MNEVLTKTIKRKESESDRVDVCVHQCDQMAILLFQYLVITSKEISPIALEVYQIWHKIVSKY